MSNYNSTSEDYTPAPFMDQHLIVAAEMTREQVTRLIARLAEAIADKDTVSLRLDFDPYSDFGDRYTRLSISANSSSLFGVTATVTDHHSAPIFP